MKVVWIWIFVAIFVYKHAQGTEVDVHKYKDVYMHNDDVILIVDTLFGKQMDVFEKDLKNFTQFCSDSFSSGDLHDYCSSQHSTLETKFRHLKLHIKGLFKEDKTNHRVKRDAGMTILFGTGLTLLGAAVAIALNDKIEKTDHKIIGATKSAIEMSAASYHEAINRPFRQLMWEMQEIAENIGCYVDGSYTPVDTLITVLEEKNISSILPPTIDDVEYWRLHKPTFLKLKDGSYVLKYILPLVRPEPYSLYAVMVGADAQGENYILDNGHHLQLVIGDVNETKYFMEAAETNINTYVAFEASSSVITKEDSTTSCTLALINGKEKEVCKKEMFVPRSHTIQLAEDFLYVERKSKFQIICGKHKISQFSALINTTTCTSTMYAPTITKNPIIVKTNGIAFEEKQRPSLGNKPFVNDLKKQLDEIFEDAEKEVDKDLSSFDFTRNWNWGIILYSFVGFYTLAHALNFIYTRYGRINNLINREELNMAQNLKHQSIYPNLHEFTAINDVN